MRPSRLGRPVSTPEYCYSSWCRPTMKGRMRAVSALGTEDSGTVGSTSVRSSRAPSWLPLLLGVAVLTLTLFMPLSWDETYWLGVARKLSGGAELYSSAVDHKSPIWFALVQLLDWLPGPFIIARATMVAIAVAAVVSMLAKRLDLDTFSIVVITSSILTASGFAITIELVAAAPLLIFVLMLRPRPILGVAAALLCVWLDVRLYLPVLLVLAHAFFKTTSRRQLVLATGLLAISGATVLLWPELRFGLVDFAASTRTYLEWSPLRQIVTGLLVLAPVGVLLDHKSMGRWWVPIAGSIALALISVYPFQHYWIYSIVFVGAAVRQTESGGLQASPVRKMLSLGALVTLVGVITVGTVLPTANLNERYASLAESLTVELPPDTTFVPFDIHPHLVAAFPERALIRSVNVQYAATPGVRLAYFRRDLQAQLASTDAVIAPVGQLEVELADPRLEELRALFLEEVSSFECTEVIDGHAVHKRHC